VSPKINGMTKHDQRSLANTMRGEPEILRKLLTRDNDRAFVQRMSDGIRSPRVDIALGYLKLYAEIKGIIGTRSALVLQINATLGVRNEDELRELVAAGRRLKDRTDTTKTPLEYGRDAIQLLALCARKEPGLLVEVEAMLHALRGASSAEVIEGSTNGDGSPHVNGGG
jgi:hypothetical protein